MANKTHHIHPTDLRGFARLAIEATTGLTDLVEAMHHRIVRPMGLHGSAPADRTTGLTGFVFSSIRGVTRLVGGGVDSALAQLHTLFGQGDSSAEREAVLAALNGVMGDYLTATGNPLAIGMRMRRNGQVLELKRSALATALPGASGKLLVLVHGLCLNDRQWSRQGHNHGSALSDDLGYTPVYLQYNSGAHISSNGRAFAELLDTLLEQWPVPAQELVIVAHSMGGLLARSACHYAANDGRAWLGKLRKMIFLGTPHHGAPLERGGNWLDLLLGSNRYSAPFARLGKIRSAGITDLRHGSILDDDWNGRDRFETADDQRRDVALPKGVQCYTIAATTGKQTGDLSDRLVGDGLVPLRSALGQNDDPKRNLAFPKSRQWIGYGMHHLELLNRPEVYATIRRWLA